MRRKRCEFGVAERGPLVQRIDRRDQRLLGIRPARCGGFTEYRGADLLVGKMRCHGEGRDMHAPFIFASRARAGPHDDDLSLPQRERAAVEQAAGAKFLPGPWLAGDGAEQQQRRRTAHDAVELLLDLGRVGRLKRRDA